jgi:hypothetical protein
MVRQMAGASTWVEYFLAYTIGTLRVWATISAGAMPLASAVRIVGLKEGQAAGELVGQLEDEAGLDAVVEEVVDAQDLSIEAFGFDAADGA